MAQQEEQKKKQNNAEEDVKEIEKEEQACKAESKEKAASSKKTKAKKGNEEIEKLQKQLADLNDRLLRSAAEFDNYRKRTNKEKDNIYGDAAVKTIEPFLTIADTFERALEAPCSDAEFKKGVDMIYHQLQQCFEKLGVKEIAALGESFDPQFHNAVMHVEDEEKGTEEIVQVLQKGYIMGEKVIRHSMVKVAN